MRGSISHKAISNLYRVLSIVYFLGYLQVLIMADALQRRSIQNCTSPGMELYNTRVVPLNIPPNVTPINILWCSLSGDKRNHIVPLQKCKDGNGNICYNLYVIPFYPSIICLRTKLLIKSIEILRSFIQLTWL